MVKEVVEEEPKEKKGGKKQRARSDQKNKKSEEAKEKSQPKPRRGGKKKDFIEERSKSIEHRRGFSSEEEYYDRRSAPRDYYRGFMDDNRRHLNKGPKHAKEYDSDYEKHHRNGGYGKMMYRPDADRYFNDHYGPKSRVTAPHHSRYPEQHPPSQGPPFRDNHYKSGPPPGMNRNQHPMNNGGHGGNRGYKYKEGPMMPNRGADFDKPDRPGYYAGSMRPFRMDKMRNEPLEREERGPVGMSAKEYRDNRNRPGVNDRR